MTTEKAFDPRSHLVTLREGGREYLEVKWRLVWLRSEHPDAKIETEKLGLDSTFAFFKASVTLPTGGTATGHGMETQDGFKDYAEKAETKALGRALAALGYGTQFCEDFQEAGVVDAPVERRPAAPRPKPAQAPAMKPEALVGVVVAPASVGAATRRQVPPKSIAELMQRAKSELGLPFVEVKRVLGIKEPLEIADIDDAWAKLCVAAAEEAKL